jgi:hypothetical protein
LKSGGKKSSGRGGRRLEGFAISKVLVIVKGGLRLLQDAMKEGEEREMKGNFRRLVEYITCARIENAVRKKGNLSIKRRRT